MTTATRLIALADAQPGMVLAAPLCDGVGNALLTEGVELNGDLLAALQRRGVTQLQIAEEIRLSEEQLAARRATVTERVKFLFRHSAADPLMSALHQVVLDYRMENLK